MPPTILLNVGEKLRERDTHKGGENSKIFNPFSLSLPKSRGGVGPDARALENTNASLARRYKTSAPRTVESPKLWPSLRGRALCDSNKKNTSEFLNASSGEKREENRSKREEKTLENIFATSRASSRSNTARFVFFVRKRERERERERRAFRPTLTGRTMTTKRARFAFPKVLHVPHF